MAKQRGKSQNLFKKTSLTSLIALLVYFLMKLIEPILPDSQRPSQTLPSSQQPVQLYANQAKDDLTLLFVDAIRSAQSSITLVIYSLLDPQVIQALKTKSETKVPVYIVCDAKASPGINKKLPLAQIVRRASKGLTHQKILVIDTQEILIGSANLTSDSLRLHGNLVMDIKNPALAGLLDQRIKSMDEADGFEKLAHVDTQAGSQHVELWMLPDNLEAYKRVIQLLQSAKKSIKVAMYTWTRIDFTKELINAAKRGVKVETVLDRYSGKGTSAKIVHMLEEASIPVRLSTGRGLLHHKFAYIDESILINGSANWTSSAFKVNDDCFVVLYPLNTQQQAKMDQLWLAISRESDLPDLVKASRNHLTE